jgi:prepilin-type N-terminal cleavage/methylation domain-containing protein
LKGGRGGFTLLEVVVATSILAAGIVGIAALLRGSLALSGGARDVTTATLYASQRLEEALLLPAPAQAEEGSFGEKYRWRLTAEPAPVEESLPVEGERFRVTVSWDDGGDRRSVELSSERWRRKAGTGG